VGCLGGTDSAATWNWAPACQTDWQAGKADGSLPALLRQATEASHHAFTTYDLRNACTAWVDAQLPADVRRQLSRAINESRSGRVVAGLTVLLALCGWIDGGDEGARRAVTSGLPPPGAAHAPSATMARRPDARRLYPVEAPELFALVDVICRRAGLRRPPQIYLLPAERGMNAYALGMPDDAVVTLTDGLLRGMTKDEVAAILAHEIAHISNNDTWTMALAASLRHAVRCVSLASMCGAPRGAPAPLAWLLHSAPAIAELLCLALSRIREFAADAFALELIAEPRSLASALEKLERHHRPGFPVAAGGADDALTGYLRSHPSTDQRVSFLHSLA
jgi:heat shock protein HtpX